MPKKKSNEPVVHEIDVFVNGGKCELLKLGSETASLKPLKLKHVKKLISIFGDILPIANKNAVNFLPDEFKLSGNAEIDDPIYNAAANQAQTQAMLSEPVLDKIIDFLCMAIDKPRDWVEENIKPSGMFQILEIMVEQNDLEDHVPFLRAIKNKK